MDSDAKHIECSSVYCEANIWLYSTMQAVKICYVLDIRISPLPPIPGSKTITTK